MIHDPADLGDLEAALLGVLCVGLPPPRAAGSDTFRVDHVTARVAALARGLEPTAYLSEDGVHVTPQFGQQLRQTIADLADKGLVTEQPSAMPAAPGTFIGEFALEIVNPDLHPAVLDRYIAQLCMEQLFNIPVVYPYLMERYAASGEVWRRLRESGYDR